MYVLTETKDFLLHIQLLIAVGSMVKFILIFCHCSMLALHELTENADCVLPIENQVRFGIFFFFLVMDKIVLKKIE